MKPQFILPAALLTAVLALSLLPGCGGKGNGSDSDSSATDTVVKVEADPSAFPVNAIPDAQFGKALQAAADPTLKASTATLAARQGALPAWLDAIVSRESIVCFGKVMAELPDEQEFVQQEAKLLDAGEWTAFQVHFQTRPSQVGMVVFGAFKSEQERYWVSLHRKEGHNLMITGLKALPDGVDISGAMATDKNSQAPFRAELKAESAKLFTAP